MIMNLKYILVNDKRFNTKMYIKTFGEIPDFENPKTFSEKLIFLKMYYNNLLQNVCADKYSVCSYIKQCGYPDIIKIMYRVYNNIDEINLDDLPDKFFIQCSHTQGFNFVVDKSDSEQFEEIKKIYRPIMKRKHYKPLRENCYKNIVPRIICSEYLEEKGVESLTDYKFYCFDGEAKYFMVSYGEFSHNVKNHKFDMNWNSIDHLFKKKESIDKNSIRRPFNFNKMVEIAERLSKPFPHVRVDLYNINGRIIFGEMTFYSNGGFVNIYSKEMDKQIASWIDLEKYRNDIVGV